MAWSLPFVTLLMPYIQSQQMSLGDSQNRFRIRGLITSLLQSCPSKLSSSPLAWNPTWAFQLASPSLAAVKPILIFSPDVVFKMKVRWCHSSETTKPTFFTHSEAKFLSKACRFSSDLRLTSLTSCLLSTFSFQCRNCVLEFTVRNERKKKRTKKIGEGLWGLQNTDKGTSMYQKQH